jgi:hypothetical protein
MWIANSRFEEMAVWDLNSNLDVFGMQTFLRGLIYVR